MNHVATNATPAGFANTEDWARFLRPLLASVPNPPNAEDFRKRVSAIAFALHDFPATLLTTTAQREAVRKFKFWPSAADLAEHFGDDLRHEREMLAIRSDRAKALPPPPPPERTPEEIEAVRAKARAFAAAMGATGDNPTREVKPAYLSGEALARARAAARIKL